MSALTDQDRSVYGELVGKSESIQKVYFLIEQVAPSSASVLITGESGTGKELVARTIHKMSPRHDKPFVAINCSAIPESLMDSVTRKAPSRGRLRDARDVSRSPTPAPCYSTKSAKCRRSSKLNFCA
jgi:Mg-chelatase subunit ChlI